VSDILAILFGLSLIGFHRRISHHGQRPS